MTHPTEGTDPAEKLTKISVKKVKGKPSKVKYKNYLKSDFRRPNGHDQNDGPKHKPNGSILRFLRPVPSSIQTSEQA